MDYLTLFSPHNLALLSDWLEETGELYVDVYQVRSGGGSSAYFIRSMNDLKSLIAKQTWPELSVTVFRRLQYPLRGIANDELLRLALEQISDGEWYSIISLEMSQYPDYVTDWGSGNTHEEFRRDFAESIGEQIGIGHDPFDYLNIDGWVRTHPNEVFDVDCIRHNQFAIMKNQDFYQPYAKNPEKYHWLIDLWQQ